MNGYSSHTLSFYNDEGERYWVKLHFKTDQGIENFTEDEALEHAGENPDYHKQDLWEAIEEGNYPTWTLKVQVMPEEEAEEYDINPFDLTRVWPHDDYPLIEVGTMELNENPDNYFAEVEQAAFSPAHVVPGIAHSPDKMLQGRIPSYDDAHRYRLGSNFEDIPVNQPKNSGRTTTIRMGRCGWTTTTGPARTTSRTRSADRSNSRKSRSPAQGLRRRRPLPHPRAD